MQRVTVTVDDELLQEFDAFMQQRGYENRSEAFRDILRERIERERTAVEAGAFCVGCLTYVYDHEERELPRRLVHAQHAHHDLSVATVHMHLDHDNCMEAMLLRGQVEDVRTFANGLIAQRGVRHGHLWMVPADLIVDHHTHGKGQPADLPHVHSRPRT